MKTLQFFFLIALALSLNSCSSGGDSDGNPNPNPDPDPDPDPNPTTITYTNTIRSIISANCISCHGSTPTNNATISLDTYLKVKTATQNNNLIGRISLTQGNPDLMPKNGTRLPQATIDKFIAWQANGYLE
nr:hypothetical protein [uncultured Flavobacterium sp.]